MRSESKIPAGDVVIEVKSRLAEKRPISPLDVVVSVDGKEVMSGTVRADPLPCSSRRTTASTSGSTGVHPSRPSTSTRHPSSSKATSASRPSPTRSDRTSTRRRSRRSTNPACTVRCMRGSSSAVAHQPDPSPSHHVAGLVPLDGAGQPRSKLIKQSRPIGRDVRRRDRTTAAGPGPRSGSGPSDRSPRSEGSDHPSRGRRSR